MCDQMRWDVMGCAGHPTVRTPNLDRLAREGRLFANAYTVAPVCSPARYSLFTGRYPHTHGALENGVAANEGEIFLTSLLKHHGYTTAISGKLHFTPKHLAYDFDYFWSYLYEGPRELETYPLFLKLKHGSARIFQREESIEHPLLREIGSFPYPRTDFMSCWIADRAIDFLRSRESAEPWFLFVSFRIPHGPYLSPEPYRSMYPPEELDVPEIPESNRGMPVEAGYVDTDDVLRRITAQYLGHVTNLDDNVGRVLGELDRLGMRDDTIVVFTSDHGEMLGDKGRWGKNLMYEGPTHVPLLMRLPAGAPVAEKFNGGEPVQEIVESIDVLPTLLDLAGIPAPGAGLEGQSFVGVATGADGEWKDRCFAECGRRTMLRDSRYKLIATQKAGGRTLYELYDMDEDPTEERDLAGNPAQREVRDGLAARLAAWRARKAGPLEVPGMPTPAYAAAVREHRERSGDSRR